MDITLQELGMAYRKAKVDLYYSMIPRLEEIAAYEEDLESNLQNLLDRVNGIDESWIEDETYLGSWTYIPKSIDWETSKPGEFHDPNLNGFIDSSPAGKWRRSLAEASTDGGHARATFRLMALCSMDLHVLSTLWVMRVGHRFDRALGKSAFGSRLRREASTDAPNLLSLGTFKPYFWPFREWRDSGIAAMRDALDDGKKVIALTGDISSYYHRLDPGFLGDQDYQDIAGVDFVSVSDQKVNRLFISSLQNWAALTPPLIGLPVGLPASAVVANAALLELDRFFEKEVLPLYYGRYVDDIMLVLENGADFQSSDDVWNWLFKRTNLLSSVEGPEGDEIAFEPRYLSASTVRFSNSKNKIFLLAGETGRTLVDSIERTAAERASEWRALPDLPRRPGKVATDLVSATQNDGEGADNLRKADLLTMRRAGFAIKLRDFEAYERDLEPGVWVEHRHAFFDAIISHVLELPSYFDLAQYLPRIVRLATICEDFQYLRKILDAVEKLRDRVAQDCTATAADHSGDFQHEIISRWSGNLSSSLEEAIVASLPPTISEAGAISWDAHIRRDEHFLPTVEYSRVADIQVRQQVLFSRDLGHAPFRFSVLADELSSKRGVPEGEQPTRLKQPEMLLDQQVVNGIASLASALNRGVELDRAVGFLFATRPLNFHELLLSLDEPFSLGIRAQLGSIMLALRGYVISERMPTITGGEEGGSQNLVIPRESDVRRSSGRRTVALASWKTAMDSWMASVVQEHEPDLNRYSRLNELVNQVLRVDQQIDYLLFPELAIPPRWYLRLAQKLQGKGISLISGVSYIHATIAGKNVVHNQVWAALTHDGLDFPSMLVVQQDKQRPAPGEKKHLQSLRDLELVPREQRSSPLIIQHGDFHFAMLICSELTNIDYRGALRGRIDALFVPEWNRDTTSFGALVESAALDLHAFIVQCNDRRYGDSRIRGPYKESWQRDIVRIKGGTRDFFVVGEIDYLSLRQFQSSDNSPSAPFKPVPDGFTRVGRFALPTMR